MPLYVYHLYIACSMYNPRTNTFLLNVYITSENRWPTRCLFFYSWSVEPDCCFVFIPMPVCLLQRGYFHSCYPAKRTNEPYHQWAPIDPSSYRVEFDRLHYISGRFIHLFNKKINQMQIFTTARKCKLLYINTFFYCKHQKPRK